MKHFLFALIVAIVSTGCSKVSTEYGPTHTTSGEITGRFHKEESLSPKVNTGFDPSGNITSSISIEHQPAEWKISFVFTNGTTLQHHPVSKVDFEYLATRTTVVVTMRDLYRVVEKRDQIVSRTKVRTEILAIH